MGLQAESRPPSPPPKGPGKAAKPSKAGASVKIFRPRESYPEELCRENPHFHAIYNVCVLHMTFAILGMVLWDSYKAGRLYLDLSLMPRLVGSGADVARFTAIECALLAGACAMHPLLKVWAWLRGRVRRGVGPACTLLFVCYVAGSWWLVVRVIFSLPLPPVWRVVLTIEHMRLSMKSYSFIRENAYKVLYPWHKDDTSGPAVWYEGQMEPTVGSFSQYLYFLFAPTLLYRDRYPRKPGSINWVNVVIYFVQFLSTILFGLLVYRDAIYPASMHPDDIVRSYVISMSLAFILLCVGHACLLQTWWMLHIELFRFADARIYTAWWTSTDFAEYFRTWNWPIHEWIKEYLYGDLRKLLRSRLLPIPISFICSALYHDFHIAVGLGFYVPVFFILYGFIGAIVFIIRPFSNQRTGHFITMFGLLWGTSMFQWYYVVELAARNTCPQEITLQAFFVPRLPQCIGTT